MISNILKKFHDIRYLNVTDLFNITSKYREWNEYFNYFHRAIIIIYN